MLSDIAESLMESFAQVRESPASEEGSTARGGESLPPLAAMGGGVTDPQQPGEAGPSTGARSIGMQPPTVEDAAVPVLPAQRTGNQRSPVDRRSPADSETPSPGRRAVTAEEAVEELRRLRDEIRELQMGQAPVAVSPSRGLGDQYKVPIPDKYSPRGQKSPSEFLFQCEQFFEASGSPRNDRSHLQPPF